MSKDGGGYGSDEFSGRDNSLSFKVTSLEKKVEECRQYIETMERSHKQQTDTLKAKVQMNIHNSAFNGLLDENKELKEYLNHALRLLSQYNDGLKREHALASKIGTTADDFIKIMKERGFSNE